MDDKYISTTAHESALAREDRKNKRLWILVIILLCMLFGSNLGWIVYESQFEDTVTIEAEQSGSEVNIVGGGDVKYGTESKDN